MNEITASHVKTFLKQLRERQSWRYLAWCALGIGALLAYFVWPALRDPYVRVHAASFALAVDCVPSSVTIHTRAGYLELQQARLTISGAPGTQSPPKHLVLLQAEPKEDSGYSFEAILDSKELSAAIAAMNAPNAAARSYLTFEFSRVPYIDITSIEVTSSAAVGAPACTIVKAKGAALLEKVKGGRPSLVHTKLPQEEISDLLRLTNEALGAVLVGFLILAIAWLMSRIIVGIWRIFICTEIDVRSRVAEGIKKRPQLQRDRDEHPESEFVTGEFQLLHRRLIFVRVLGPATGFLLTVSSLVAGLHPSVHSAQDSFLFISSLQLALVATFVGLLIRILAEFAIRLHTSAAERALLIVAKKGKQ